MNLYITADEIGTETGAGHVCKNELEALREVRKCKAYSAPEVSNVPFAGDEYMAKKIANSASKTQIAHFYAGTFSKTVALLKEHDVAVTYTVAAHNIEYSKQAHEDLGLEYNYPHMTEPDLLKKYIQGYKDADIVIAPSKHSADVLKSQGCKTVKIIPHGCDLPTTVAPLPSKFTVGYLGSVGADKGLIHLIKAWAKLNYDDAILILAGNQSLALLPLVREIGKGAIHFLGWVKSPSDLYNKCSVYVQPSSTEGFGCEVIEAMSHGRPVVCSDGAGAADCIERQKNGIIVPRRDHDALADAIDFYKRNPERIRDHGAAARETSEHYAWPKIRAKYLELWRGIK